MNTQQALQKVRRGLEGLGFRETAPSRWELKVPAGLLTVSTLESGNPCYRCQWSDGQYQDVVFFEFGLSETFDRAGVNDLLVWAAWYARGNRLTGRGTVGYAGAEALAA